MARPNWPCETIYSSHPISTWQQQDAAHTALRACVCSTFAFCVYVAVFCLHERVSLVPRPPPFFCSSVCVQYNTRKRKSAKNGEGLVSFITCVTSGGREEDVVGRGTTANMFAPTHSRTGLSIVSDKSVSESSGVFLCLLERANVWSTF